MFSEQANRNLLRAASQGNIKSAEKALAAGAAISYVGSDLNTPLLKAAINMNAEMVDFLVKQGASIHEVGKDGETSLIIAARQNDLKLLEVCISHHIDIEARDNDDKSALYVAVCKDHIDVVKRLVDLGANVDTICDKKSTKETPLTVAAAYGRTPEMVDFLLNHGADINKGNVYKETALMRAAIFRKYETVKLLLEKGADYTLKNGSGYTVLEYVKTKMNIPDMVALLEAFMLEKSIETNSEETHQLEF